MDSILFKAIDAVQKSTCSLTKFITANDAGATGAHQAGFHIPKNAWSLFFESEGRKGENRDKFVTIRWQDDFETESRFIYYGVGTRNEYRLTRFGRGFPFLEDDSIGDLLVISKINDQFYQAYVLTSDEEIEEFLTTFNLSTKDINGIIPSQLEETAEKVLLECFSAFVKKISEDFPPTKDLALNARKCYNAAYRITEKHIIKNPDKEILAWLDAEYQLFKVFENERYSNRIKKQFESVEELIELANTILNRRKSRAGKSLEHHLAEIFKTFKISFSDQEYTEDKKKPDFIFPGAEEYINPGFDERKLVTLAAKTTCKDRWRQVLTEADRVKTKHLFTLQQGISSNQLEEMQKSGVQLVVPLPNLKSFPEKFRNQILSLNSFVNHVKLLQQF